MRPVRLERNPRSRTKEPTRPARGGKRSSSQQAFGRRARKPGAIARLFWRVRGWLTFRKPMVTLCFGLLLLVLIAGLFVSGTVARTIGRVEHGLDGFVANAGFGIAEVHLSGNARTPPETILAALGFQPGESIFGADLQSARLRLKKLDWVADADVQRRYPDAISVRLVEKLPFALWKPPAGNICIVDRSGAVITDKDVAQFARLPLLIGDAAPAVAADLVDAVAQHRAVAARVKGYERVSQRRWNLILDGDVVVKLPETGWHKELDTLEHMIVDQGVLERAIAEIDLRIPSHYFFGLKGAKPESKHVDRGREL
ncbi:MAG: FtsQ-type POTRA domain-containing protein [Alphaproteobacteria bacterium]|nr:FtsQ-type POTRA domain-containing protein [Alphaproteobacteria bacterium]MBV9693069.1 FtsQ-type POTRA domain-containing protein [Alphaproteobacteria bacterium]